MYNADSTAAAFDQHSEYLVSGENAKQAEEQRASLDILMEESSLEVHQALCSTHNLSFLLCSFLGSH